MSTFEPRRDVTRRESNDPRRATNMLSPVAEPRGSSINPSPSGSRSGNFPSRIFTPPTKQPDHSQIPPRTPNDLNGLVKAFTQYTDSVVATSNSQFQSNLLKEKAERQQNLKDRWSKHYHSFISLAEDHDRVSEKAESVAEAFENQMKQTRETQEAAVRALMSTMVVNSVAANPKLEEYSSLREDVRNLKDGLRATNADLDDTRYEVKRTTGVALQQDVEDRLKTLGEYEKHIAELTVVHSKLQATVNQHEQLLVQLPDIRNRVQKLNASQNYFTELIDKTKQALEMFNEQQSNIKNLREDLISQKTSIQDVHKDLAAQNDDFKQSLAGQKHQIDAFVEDFAAQRENLTRSIAAQEKKIETLIGDLAVQKGQVDSLNIELVGDPHEKSDKKAKGLIDYIAEGSEKSDKFEGALKRFDNELGSFSEKLGTLENGMHMLESRAPIQDFTSTKVDGASHNLDDNSINRISSLEEQVKPAIDSVERIAELERQTKLLEEQQEIKDDIVSAEVERLDNLLIQQEKALEPIQVDLSALKSQVSSASANKPPTPPPQVEIQREPDDLFRLKVEELESTLRLFKESSTERVEAMEVLVDSQQQRFDNLSTEHLAKSIIHQMQLLYPPHPAGLQVKFDHIKAKQTAVDQHVLNFANTVSRLTESANNQTARVDHLHGRLFPSLEKRVLDVTKGLSDSLQEVERRMSGLDASARNHHALENLEKRFTESPKPPSDAQGGFERRLGDFKKSSLERFDSLDRKYTDLKQNSSKRFGELERNQSELAKSVTGDQLDWRAVCHNLRKDLDDQISALQNVRTSISTTKAENTSMIATFQDTVKAIDARLRDVEATTTEEISSLHAKLITLKKRISLRQSESPVAQDPDSDIPLAQQATSTKSLRNTAGPAAEKQERQERQERQLRQKAKRKKAASPSDTSESSDSDPPVTRPVRKSSRGIQLTEKKMNSTLRGHSRSGGEPRS